MTTNTQIIELTSIPSDQVPNVDWVSGDFKVIGVKEILVARTDDNFDYVKILALPDADPIDPAIDPILIKAVIVKNAAFGWIINEPVFYALWRNVAWKILTKSESEHRELCRIIGKTEVTSLQYFADYLQRMQTLQTYIDQSHID